jgi:hypothetical protein
VPSQVPASEHEWQSSERVSLQLHQHGAYFPEAGDVQQLAKRSSISMSVPQRPSHGRWRQKDHSIGCDSPADTTAVPRLPHASRNTLLSTGCTPRMLEAFAHMPVLAGVSAHQAAHAGSPAPRSSTPLQRRAYAADSASAQSRCAVLQKVVWSPAQQWRSTERATLSLELLRSLHRARVAAATEVATDPRPRPKLRRRAPHPRIPPVYQQLQRKAPVSAPHQKQNPGVRD